MIALKRLAILLIPLLVVLLYANAFHGEFVFDDIKLVRDNPHLGDVGQVCQAFNVFSDHWEKETVRINYRPVRFLSYALDYHITRWLWPGEATLRTTVFHVHNILLHGLNALLVFLLLRALLGERGGTGIFCGFLALVWAMHPLQTEAVTYVSGRRDVLFTMFYLLALLWYARRPPTTARMLAVAGFYLLAVLTKEMAVTLPAALILVDLFMKRPWTRRIAAGHGLVWLICLGFIAFKLGLKNPGGGAGYWGGSLLTAMLTESRAVFLYLRLFLLPLNQSIDWSYAAIVPSSGLFAPWTTFPALLVLAVLVGLAVYGILKKRWLAAMGFLFFLAALSPVMQLMPHPERFAERFMYLPLLGLLFCVIPVFQVLKPFKTGLVLGILLLLFLSGRTFQRNEDWLSREKLWERAVVANPRCARAHFAMGVVLTDQRQWAGAATHFDSVFAILADKPKMDPLERGYLLQSRFFRGQSQTRQAETIQAHLPAYAEGDPKRLEKKQKIRALYQSAAEDYKALLTMEDVDGRPIAEDPRQAGVFFALGATYFALEAYPEARDTYRRLLNLDPEGPFALQSRFWLGMVAMATGKVTHGRSLIILAAQKADDLAEKSETPEDRKKYHDASLAFRAQLADILFKIGRFEESLALIDKVIPQVPRKDQIPLKYQKAQIFDRLGDRVKALFMLQQLLEEDPTLLPVKLTLVDLFIKEGRIDEAKSGLAAMIREHGRISQVVALEKQIQLQEMLTKKDAVKKPGKLTLDTLFRTGRINLDDRQWTFAENAFKEAYLLADAAGNEEKALIALRYLAKSLNGKGEVQQALTVLRQALKLSPGDNRFLKDVGNILSEHVSEDAHFQEALQAFRQLEREATDALARFEACLAMGKLYDRRNQIEEAVLQYEKAHQAAGILPPGILLRSGIIWKALGDADKAREAFHACLDGTSDQTLKSQAEAGLQDLQSDDAGSGGEAREGDGAKLPQDKGGF